jgi:hypothetical protein
MTLRLATLPLAAALLAVLLLGVPRAHAATFLGSLDTTAPPDGFVCAQCPAGTAVGYRQFALRQSTVEAQENGILVSASVHAKRVAPGEEPRIAVLRPDDDGVSLTVVDSAPLPVASAAGELHRVDDLHLPVQRGDSLGFLFRAGEVDLGMRVRPRPDGAIQSFTSPCDPCGMDGGTGVELLLDAVVEPDVDADGMGDESQDADGGGLGMDWEEDWFDDYEAGDQLDEDFGEDEAVRPRGPQRLRVLQFQRLRGGRASMLLRVPRKGRVSASVTLPAERSTGAGPFTTILTGEMRVRRSGRVRLLLAPTPSGERVLSKRRRVRTKVVVAYFPRKAALELRMRSARL